MYGAGTRKLSVITSVSIQGVSVERGFTVKTIHCIIIFTEKQHSQTLTYNHSQVFFYIMIQFQKLELDPQNLNNGC